MKPTFLILAILCGIIFLGNDLGAYLKNNKFDTFGIPATVDSLLHHGKIEHGTTKNKVNFMDNRQKVTLKFHTESRDMVIVNAIVFEKTLRAWESGEVIKLVYLKSNPRQIRIKENESPVFDWAKGWFLAIAAIAWKIRSVIKPV